MSGPRLAIIPSRAVSDERIPLGVFRTLAALGLYADRDGWCWPSLRTLAGLRGIAPQSVSRHIKLLKGLGYLEIHPRWDQETGARRSNMVQINFNYPQPPTSTSESIPLKIRR